MLDIPRERIDWRAKGFWLPDASLTAADVAAARPQIFGSSDHRLWCPCGNALSVLHAAPTKSTTEPSPAASLLRAAAFTAVGSTGSCHALCCARSSTSLSSACACAPRGSRGGVADCSQQPTHAAS